MKTQKALPDKDILHNVIEALRISDTKYKDMNVQEFAKKLQYGSHVTVYNVLNDKNGISKDMIHRIILSFPQVSYNYLTRGQGTPIIEGGRAVGQSNILNIKNWEAEEKENAPVGSMADFLYLPENIKELNRKMEIVLSEIASLKKMLSEK